MSEDIDRVAEMFKGKCIFVSGGTGFMGKVLVEKILRSCTGVKTMYLLVRPKKGKDPKQRLEEIFSSALFETVKNQRGLAELMSHCKIVSGDVTQINLGISEDDRKEIIENVDIIYHMAATIRFDSPLKEAVLLNTRGTKFMLDLAKECKNLKMFAHVSTSYCHLHEKVLLEKPYDPPANPHDIIKCVEWMDEDLVNSMTKKILGNLPNTYAFTKALAEGLVVEAMQTIPAIIIRPSIVIPVWKEPIPGWTDNINGPAGLLIGAGKGVIRTMYCNQTGYADYLPVDIAVNGLLVVTWNYIANNDKERNVLHFTSSDEFKVSWQEIVELGRRVIEERLPLNGVAWYPGGSMKSSKILHYICLVLFHFIPAVLVDCLLYALGYKPVLCRVQRRIMKGFEVFEYYANNQWDFVNEHASYVRGIMNPLERKIYKIDGDGLDLMDYFEACIHCSRLYVLNETDDTLPAARRHMRVMYWVDKLTKLGFFCLMFYWISGFFFTTSTTLEPIAEL
ncbi:putative fatty acyl-CoA reductase CG5065 [Ctenocephalides felis]|uniref:putative fatty acyl-CoA reductase CG5065 n=1 Tax=Ctenocephalides felis TaxID=7515 RepID=UPI000E6E383E|nr:putative fatty acyl-CoA reductase CG5065 [Ctenocephalides felis]